MAHRLNAYRLYDAAQKLYTILPYAGHPGGAAFPPLRYCFHLTYRCNLNCPFCFIEDRTSRDELSTEEWMNVIDQVPRWSVISFTGGEVTLRQDFMTILEHALHKHRVNLITNGLRLDGPLADLLVRRRLFLLAVSLDAIGPKHDSLRGREGTFDTVITNLKKLVALRGSRSRPLLDIKTVVLEENLDELPALYRLARELDAESFTVSFLRGCALQQAPRLRDAFTEEFWKQTYPVQRYVDLDKFEQAYREMVADAANADTALRVYPNFGPERGERELATIKRFFTVGPTRDVADLYTPCRHPWANVYVNQRGDVYPCLALRMGNVRDQPLRKILNNAKYREFRRRLRMSGVFRSCQTCCYANVCVDLDGQGPGENVPPSQSPSG